MRFSRFIHLAFLFSAPSWYASETNLLTDIPTGIWDHSVELRTDAGYKDNVLLSKVQPVESAFILGGADVILVRQSLLGSELLCMAGGENTHYLTTSQAQDERMFHARAIYKMDFSSEWQSSAGLQYLFQNQMFDSSTSETDIGSVLALGHRLESQPSVRRNFGNNFYAEVQLNMARQWFDSPLDSYWEFGPRITAGHEYGNKSKIRLYYEFLNRPYDTRSELDSAGNGLEGTHLAYHLHEVGAVVDHYFDTDRAWMLRSGCSVLLNLDNASGYFDYQRGLISETVRWRFASWELQSRIKCSYYNYPVQPVSTSDASLRHKLLASGSLRVEKKLFKHLGCHVECEYETSLSNSAFDEYKAATVSSGVTLEF